MGFFGGDDLTGGLRVIYLQLSPALPLSLATATIPNVSFWYLLTSVVLETGGFGEGLL